MDMRIVVHANRHIADNDVHSKVTAGLPGVGFPLCRQRVHFDVALCFQGDVAAGVQRGAVHDGMDVIDNGGDCQRDGQASGAGMRRHIHRAACESTDISLGLQHSAASQLHIGIRHGYAYRQ